MAMEGNVGHLPSPHDGDGDNGGVTDGDNGVNGDINVGVHDDAVPLNHVLPEGHPYASSNEFDLLLEEADDNVSDILSCTSAAADIEMPGSSGVAVARSAAAAGGEGGALPSVKPQAEAHLSCKYTKEQLMARHWGMNLDQMKRVKALLTMGVSEEDLVVAGRLLKLGRYVGRWGDVLV